MIQVNHLPLFFSSYSHHITSHQPPGQYPGQTAHHRQHHTNIRPRRRRIRLENWHVPPAVFLATDGVAGVESRHAVAHLGQLGVLVRRRRDDGLVRGRGKKRRRSRRLEIVYSGGLKLDKTLRDSLVGCCRCRCRGRWRCTWNWSWSWSLNGAFGGLWGLAAEARRWR